MKARPGSSRKALLVLALAGAGGACGNSLSGNADPLASFTLTLSGTDAPLTVRVDASASSDPDGIVTSYRWDFADGATASGVTAQHTYQVSGGFEIELRVTDDAGGEGRTRRVAVVGAPPVSYAGLYASDLLAPTELLLVLDFEGSLVSGTLRDTTGRTGVVTGSTDGTNLFFDVQLTTPSCPGTWLGQGMFTADGIEFTFSGPDCFGDHTGGVGEVLRHAGEILAFGEADPAGLIADGGELFWSSDSPAPLKRYTPATGTLAGLAPRIGPILGVAAEGTRVLWTELLDEGAGSCGSETSTIALRRTDDGTSLETLDEAGNCSRDVSSDVVVAAGAVFWAQHAETTPATFTIRRTPLDGSPSAVPVTTTLRIRALAADDTHLYWSEEGDAALDPSRVWRVPHAGGVPEELHATAQRPFGLALTATDVLVAERAWATEDGALVRVPKAGGASSVLASFASPARRVVTDGTTIAWLTDAEVGILAPGPGPAIPLASALDPAVDLALDGDRLLWIESSPLCCAGRLRAVPLAGGAAVTLSAATSPLRLARALDGSSWWSEGGIDPAADPALMRWTELSGSHTRVGGLERSPALAADASHVYCVQGWWIKRVARGGGVPERFARGDFFLADVALDADFVYWVEPPLGTVRRRAKLGGPIETLSVGNGNAGALVVAGGQVLWVEGPDTIRAAPVTGGPAAVFAGGIEFPTELVSDGEFAYFDAQDAGLLRRQPLAGGLAEIVGGFGGGSLTSLAVDEDSLYAIGQIQLVRFPKVGGLSAAPIQVRNDVFAAGSVASAGEHVYWAETLLGTVGRRYVGPLEAR